MARRRRDAIRAATVEPSLPRGRIDPLGRRYSVGLGGVANAQGVLRSSTDQATERRAYASVIATCSGRRRQTKSVGSTPRSVPSGPLDERRAIHRAHPRLPARMTPAADDDVDETIRGSPGEGSNSRPAVGPAIHESAAVRRTASVPAIGLDPQSPEVAVDDPDEEPGLHQRVVLVDGDVARRERRALEMRRVGCHAK